MKKLIKLSESHYIIVDDSEIKDGDFVTNGVEIFLRESMAEYSDEYANKYWQKITHSFGKELEGVINRPLSEVEEVVYGYNLKKMAKKNFNNKTVHNSFDNLEISLMESSFIEGFKAHQELAKDKLLVSIQDLRKVILQARIREDGQSRYSFDEITQPLLPKKEWEVEFDENGKIKLI